jgi:integrase
MLFQARAMPKGLRHGFGTAAFQSVPPHLVQRWLGHASLRRTAIYGDVVGKEERRRHCNDRPDGNERFDMNSRNHMRRIVIISRKGTAMLTGLIR